LASGFIGGRHRLYRTATEAVDRALVYAYRDRRTKKRDFRRLWIARISAAAKINEISYSRLMGGLKKACVEIDRKILSNLAILDSNAFSQIVKMAN
jgi:large subunit ribosomal protein L20